MPCSSGLRTWPSSFTALEVEKNIPDIKQALIYSECDLLDPAQKLKLYMDRRLGGISPKNFKMTGEVSAQL